MVFSSVIFLFLFLPATIAAYYIIPSRLRKLRNLVLLGASIVFYAYGGPKLLPLLLLSVLINYFAGILAGSDKGNTVRKASLIISVLFNIGMLFYYKYTDFFITNINGLTGLDIALKSIALPLGISFFTFQNLSYVIDVYRGRVSAQKNHFELALYITLFPKLLLGPIVRYQAIEPQLSARKSTPELFADGICRLIIGLGKKLLIANSMGIIADRVFSTDFSLLSCGLSWVGVAAYTLQIYFDFSGYSDMAIGIGKLFGFEFTENFNYPYIARSITDFWRRWHISLSTWFRDYVYIPLGGNRATKIKHIRNIMIVWLLTGFWHGAAWNFIVWGLYFGILLLIEKYFILKKLEKLPAFFQHLYAIFFIMLGWVIFRSDSIAQIWDMLRALLGLSHATDNGQALFYIKEYKAELFVAVLASTPLAKFIGNRLELSTRKKAAGIIKNYGAIIFLSCVFLLSIVYLIKSTYNSFLYFKF